MNTLSLNVNVPTSLTQLGLNKSEIQNHVAEWLVLSLFTQDRISSGKSAQLLKLSRIEFFALLRKYHIDYLNYSEEELSEEFEAVSRLKLEK